MRTITRAVTAALVSLALALVTATASTAATATFTDPAGDSQGAPDITAVSVSTDTAGVITFKVTVAGFTTVAPGAENLTKVYIDADRNDSTGAAGQGGIEYTLAAWRGPDGTGWSIYRWNGSKYVSVTQSAAMSFTRAGNVLAWTVSNADLGGTTGFGFYVWSSSWDSTDTMVGEDDAPDDGGFVYTLPAVQAPAPTTTTPARPAVKPVIAAPISTPLTAVAGKRFTVVFPVTRSDTGKPMTLGKLVGDSSVLGKAIPHAESFTGGSARLSFTIPKTAQGKLLKVKVTVVAGTQWTTKTVGFKVV
jgi:hypothetical protein